MADTNAVSQDDAAAAAAYAQQWRSQPAAPDVNVTPDNQVDDAKAALIYRQQWDASRAGEPVAAPTAKSSDIPWYQYIASKAMGGALQYGDALANTQTAEDTGELGTQNSSAVVNQKLFGTPSPSTTSEAAKLAGAGVGALTGGGPLAVANPALALSTFSGGIGSQAGGDIARAYNAGPLVQGAAEFAGGLAGGIPGYGIGARLGNGWKMPGGLPSTWSAGLADPRNSPSPFVANPSTPVLSGTGISTNKALQAGMELQGEFDKTPMGQYQPYAQGVADQYGAAKTPTQIGDNIMSKSQAWIEANKTATTKAFSDFENTTMPKTEPTSLYETQKLVTAPTDGPKPPAIFGELADAIDKGNGSLSYGATKDFRSKVGALIDYDTLHAGGQDNRQLNALYGSLSKDMEANIAQTGGEPAVAAFGKMNAAAADSRAFIEQRMTKLADQGLDPFAVHQSLTSNPAKTAAWLQDLQTRGVINRSDLDMIARQQMTKIGQDANGLWNPSTFSKNVVKLRQSSPEAEGLLFRGTSDQATAYDNLVTNSRLLDQAATSPMNAANRNDGGTIAKLLGKFVKASVGAYVGSHIGGAGAEAVGAIMGGGAEGAAHETGNALYRVAQQPWFNRVGTKLVASPEKATAYLSSMARLHPQYADDLNTLGGAISASGAQSQP